MKLIVQLTEEDLNLSASLIEEDLNIILDFGDYQVIHILDPLPEYSGSYVITPEINSQWLDTDNKKLTEDLHILAIPRSDVSNPYGGITVTIG